LMHGSVSTLAPVFAAAFATRSSHAALLVGLAASLGAGISMGFAEALSDDGSLTGRGKPVLRGIVCGLMTTAGGIGHALPFLIPNFRVATGLAVLVVAIELLVISWIRNRYMDTPFLRAAFQVIVGGVCVFIVGILIGSFDAWWPISRTQRQRVGSDKCCAKCSQYLPSKSLQASIQVWYGRCTIRE